MYIWHSWPTSYRFYEQRLLPALCGCRSAADKMLHYMNCSQIWRAAISAVKQTDWFKNAKFQESSRALPAANGDVKVLQRLCLQNFSLCNAFIAVVAQQTYGIIKFQRLNEVIQLIERTDTEALARVVRECAEVAARHVVLNAPQVKVQHARRVPTRRSRSRSSMLGAVGLASSIVVSASSRYVEKDFFAHGWTHIVVDQMDGYRSAPLRVSSSLILTEKTSVSSLHSVCSSSSVQQPNYMCNFSSCLAELRDRWWFSSGQPGLAPFRVRCKTRLASLTIGLNALSKHHHDNFLSGCFYSTLSYSIHMDVPCVAERRV